LTPSRLTVNDASGVPGVTNSVPLKRMPVPPAASMKLPSALMPRVILLPLRIFAPV
jgi:hypothetical protein